MEDNEKIAPSQGVTIDQLRGLMREGPTWLPHQMQHFQRNQLAQLLRHAQLQVPFYKDRLTSVISADGTINWDRWLDIPIVTRADLRDRTEDMLAKAMPPNHGFVRSITSSGSTGIPITIRFAELFVHVAQAAWERFFESHGVNLRLGKTQFKTFLPDGSPMTERFTLPPKGKRNGETLINRNLETAEKLELLKETKSWFLMDTPNHTEVLAHENLRRKHPIKLKYIVGIGMGISAAQEALFGRSFGAKTLTPYSSKEGTLMAYQCAENRSNFHVCSELVVFEVLNSKNQSCAVGEKGRVIITPLFNSAQPLIRYAQGDEVVRGAPCRCGSNLPVLSEISGRSDAIFRFPNKDIAVTRFDDDLVQKELNADAFQFAQVEPMRIIVRYVSPNDAAEENCYVVRKHLHFIVRCEPTIDFQRVLEIPYNSGGKQQRVTREFEID